MYLSYVRTLAKSGILLIMRRGEQGETRLRSTRLIFTYLGTVEFYLTRSVTPPNFVMHLTSEPA